MIFAAERGYPRLLGPLGAHIGHHSLELLTRKFLHQSLRDSNTDSVDSDSSVRENDLPHISSKVSIYHSAVAVFYAPSDNCGIHGMKRERIRCSPSWFGVPRRDTVLVTINENRPGFRGMSAARLVLLFSFTHQQTTYPCALVQWYNTHGHGRDPKTGLWKVKPAFYDQRKQIPCLAVVHLDSLLRGVHLIPVYGAKPVPAHGLHYYHSLDVFTAFYVNKYADYHVNEIVF